MNPSKLTRKQIREGLEQTPINDILGAAASSNLTSKQKAYAMNLAKGEPPSAAYKKAFNRKGKPEQIATDAWKLKQRPDVIQMKEAYEAAIRAQEYQTPAALRALVIQSLVQVLIDPESKAGQITAAAKVLGTVTEVAAFTERKEVTTITSSVDARERVMAQLRDMMNAQAVDVEAVETEAATLLSELTGTSATPTTPNEGLESHSPLHTIPHKGSEQEPIPDKRSQPEPHPPSNPAEGDSDANLETPPA